MTALRDNNRTRWRCVLLLTAAGICGGTMAQTVPLPVEPPGAENATAPGPEAAPAESIPQSTEPSPTPAEAAPTPAAPPAERPAVEHAPVPAAPAPRPPDDEITPAETEAARAQPSATEQPGGPSAADATASTSRSDAYAEFRRLFDERKYEQALVQARQVAVLTEQQGDGDDLQVALMNLAATQNLTNDFVGAEATYLRVIELIEASGARASPRLARAKAGVAVAYHDAGSHELAAARFESAIALARRSEGLFDEGQLPLLDKYTDSLTSLQRLEDALKAQAYGL